MSFQSNPLNNDLIGIKNENAIARSVKNIIFTEPGEKFFNEDFGSRVTKLLFENVDDIVASELKDEIVDSLVNYEPRISLIDVNITPDYENNSFDAVITYEIVGADVPPQELEFALQPTR